MCCAIGFTVLPLAAARVVLTLGAFAHRCEWWHTRYYLLLIVTAIVPRDTEAQLGKAIMRQPEADYQGPAVLVLGVGSRQCPTSTRG